MKYHTRHEYIALTGKRISKGGWERLNTAYDVHHSNNRYMRVGDGVIPCVTYVLMPETTKANRKVSLRDKYNKNSKRERYKGKPIGETR